MMSLRVGLGASQADLDVQGEIDFDFFDESDSTNNLNKERSRELSSATHTNECSNVLPRSSVTSVAKRYSDITENNSIPTKDSETCSSRNINKPVIRISCDDATGMVQKTTIETVIPTPYNYKDNKCGKVSPSEFRKGRTTLSPRLKGKVFKDDNDVSDDSSISSMSDSEESDLTSSISEDSFELNESDSMTDVSPMPSPFKCYTPVASEKDDIGGAGTSSASKENKKEGVKFVDDENIKECSKCGTIDLHELVCAMNRLQMTQNVNAMHTGKCKSPIMTQNVKCRKNLSFSNEEVRKIDNDNQVLLKKIIAQQNRVKPNNISTIPNRASSAVSRQRQQRQIELENLALLKRLEAAKPTKNLSRSFLLHEYDQRTSGLLSRASSRCSYPSSSSQSSFRTSSQTSGRSSAISIKSSNSSVHNKSLHSSSKI